MQEYKSTGLLRELGLAAKYIGLYIHDRFLTEGIELTRPQFVLLKVLSEENGQCQNELAFITDRDKTSMTRLVSSMEKKGLVRRKVDKNDLRKKAIYLTSDGHKLLARAMPIMAEIEHSLSIDLDPQDLQTTVTTINKIQTKVLTTNGVKL